LEPLLTEPWLRVTAEEIDGLFARAAIAAFPHWSGGGTDFAALNAMAFGLPVVATPIGAEGTPGDEDSGIAVRLHAEPFAEEVVNLLTDERLYAGRSTAVGAYAEKTFYVDVPTAPFLGINQNG